MVPDPNKAHPIPSNEEQEYQSERPKHPLENTWCMWLYKNENDKKWEKNLVELAAFDTVEDYWCLYHHMKLPSTLLHRQDYALFKKGIVPKWEDKANRDGGRWFINLDKQTSTLDSYWLDLVLLMIGENFGSSNDAVCGAVVNVRTTGSRITVWTRNSEEKVVLAIGKRIKQQLKINFKLHYFSQNVKKFCFVC